MSRAERDEREAAKHEKKVQWLSYKFERYREDGTDTAKRPTRAEWGKRKLPVPADHRNGIQVALGPVEFEPCVGPAVLPDLDNTGSADDLPDARDRAAVEKLHDLQTWFNGTDIHYQKVLGYGSSNLALHYKFGSGPGATDFVLKVALGNPREDPRIRKEAEILRKVRRSQHIVQTISPRDIGKAARTDARPQPPDDDSSGVEEKSSGDESAPSDNGPEPRTKRRKRDEGELRDRSKGVRRRRREYKRARRDREAAADAADPLQNRDFLLLEYMENGDLESLIQRLNERKQTCPNRVLWSFWVCLIRACIAMVYPVHKFNTRRGDSKVAGLLSEALPAGETKRKWMRSMVHFAINPSNVLIGKIPTDTDHSEHEHEILPVLKLTGFAQADITKGAKNQVRSINSHARLGANHGESWYYERRRTWGRHGYYAPEQFLESWDKVGIDKTGSDVNNQPIAGTYGPALNIWGIAMTMVTLITRCEPLTPPRVAKIKLFARKGDKLTKWWNHFSYGAMLVREKDERWEYVDMELRETLAKCLARDPAHRPGLNSLLDQAVKKREGEGSFVYADSEVPATKQYMRAWLNSLLEDAQPGQ